MSKKSAQSKEESVKEALAMTSDTVGRDILLSLISEIKLLPDVWAKIPKAKQDDVIDRLRERVQTKIAMAVHLIASDNRTVVAGDIEQITIKDGVKAVIKLSAHQASIHELYDSQNKAVLIVVATPDDHLGGMDDIKGESDQRAMDLGQEYKPDSDGDGMDDSNVVDAEIKTISHGFLETELQQAYGDGQLAAQEGKPQSDCPIMAGDLCIEWVKGWKAWHEEHTEEGAAA